jgi:hypothetical protein
LEMFVLSEPVNITFFLMGRRLVSIAKDVCLFIFYYFVVLQLTQCLVGFFSCYWKMSRKQANKKMGNFGSYIVVPM